MANEGRALSWRNVFHPTNISRRVNPFQGLRFKGRKRSCGSGLFLVSPLPPAKAEDLSCEWKRWGFLDTRRLGWEISFCARENQSPTSRQLHRWRFCFRWSKMWYYKRLIQRIYVFIIIVIYPTHPHLPPPPPALNTPPPQAGP